MRPQGNRVVLILLLVADPGVNQVLGEDATLQQMNISVETSHGELAAGQHEIDFTREDALRATDNLVTARYALKAVAQKRGFDVTFMPKPVQDMEGSGLHVHQSLFNIKGGKNAFSNPADEYGLSETARQFMRGCCTTLAV